MVGEISYVKPNDILQASEWNKVADYCNGPGEWSDQSQFISTRKGTIYQSSTQINPRMQPPRDLLRTEFRTWQLDENHLCSTAFIQLGPSYDQTRLEFKIEDKPIEFIAVCPLSSDPTPTHQRAYIVDDATTSCWNAISGQGIINTFIPYGYNVVGQLVEVNLISSYFDPLSGDVFSPLSGVYGLVVNDWYVGGDPAQLSTMMPVLSDLLNNLVADTGTYDGISSLELKYEFEIFAQTRYTFEDEDQMSAWVSAVNIQPYIQCHIGGLDMFPKTSNPEPFDIEKGSIVRQYMMVGNKIMAVGNDISGGSTDLTSFFEEDFGVIACKVSDQVLSGQYTQALELTGYHNLEELIADQSSPYYSIIPLYQFDLSAGQKLVCDFRHGPRSQNFESLGW